MNGVILLVLGLSALGGALVLAVLTAGARVRAVEPALAAIETQYGRAPAVVVSPATDRELSPLLDRLRSLTLRLSPARFTGSLRRRLDLAGNPGNWTPDRVLASKGAGLIGLGVLGLLLGAGSLGMVVLFGAVGAVGGFFLPDALLYNAGVKRQDRIRRSLPDTLDMLTVCVEAGLGFDAAFAQVARNTEGPLAAECARVLQEMQFGSSRVDALRALSERTSVTELRVLVSALVQATDLGVPVAKVLREQAAEMRVRRRQRAEEQAQKVPVKILFPLIFCLFPALFVVIIGPGVISISHSLFGR